MSERSVNVPQLKDLIRRSILTLASVPDPDLRYRLGPKTAWPEFVRYSRDAYGSAPPRVRSFTPSRYDLTICLEVLGWVSWYGRTRSQNTVKLFQAWTFGAPMWQLQERCETNRRTPASKSTVENRLNNMVRVIAETFFEDVLRVSLDAPRETVEKEHRAAEEPSLLPPSRVSDVAHLPKSVASWRAPAEEPSASSADAQAELERRLERNRSRAAKRAQQAATRP